MSDGIDWNDIINAAVAVYGIKQGQKAPKFYVAPQTPEDAWTTEAKHSLFNYASNYTDQFLRGLNSGNGLNPDWHMPNGNVGNPAFMGGIRIPTVDFSKMPAPPSGTPTATPPGGSAAPDSTRDPSKPTPLNPTSAGPSTPSGFGGGFSTPPGGSTDGGGIDIGAVKSWWQNFQQDHPSWASAGVGLLGTALTAAFGPLAGLAFKALLGFGKDGGIDPNTIDPNTGKPFGSFAGGPQDGASNPLNGGATDRPFGGYPEPTLPGWGNSSNPTYSNGTPINPSDFTPGGGGNDGNDAYLKWLASQNDFSVFDRP